MAHMHYKGTGKVHSFRGILADSEERKIRIQGPVGAIAWRVTKFQIITKAPGTATLMHVVKIYRETQSSITGTVDFSDAELLGCAANQGLQAGNSDIQIIFDNDIFVRNIFVSAKEIVGASGEVNYYIELEEVKVSKAGMAQLAVAAARRTID